MGRQTRRALFVSFLLHIGLLVVMSPFLVDHFIVEKESLSVEILEAEPEDRPRQRVLPPRPPVIPAVREEQESAASPAAPREAPEVTVPKALRHADVIPDIVTYADLPQANSPSGMSNASSGADGALAGPVAIEGQRGTGVGGPERGEYGTGNRFGQETGAADIGQGALEVADPGLGIFDTDVMAGHGLIGQVYVPGGRIYRMPNFEKLTPIYTFVAANLDVSERDYTAGFPTPKLQSVLENFAIRFRGVLAIDTPGVYGFGLYADDGAKLYVNGELVVNNDGVHAARGATGKIALGAGMHPVEIHYFQGPRYRIALQWYYQPPTGAYSASRTSISVETRVANWRWESSFLGRIVPPDIIYRPGEPRIPDALRKLQQRLQKIEGEQ